MIKLTKQQENEFIECLIEYSQSRTGEVWTYKRNSDNIFEGYSKSIDVEYFKVMRNCESYKRIYICDYHKNTLAEFELSWWNDVKLIKEIDRCMNNQRNEKEKVQQEKETAAFNKFMETLRQLTHGK